MAQRLALLIEVREVGLWVIECYTDDRKSVGPLSPDGLVGDAIESAALLGGGAERIAEPTPGAVLMGIESRRGT